MLPGCKKRRLAPPEAAPPAPEAKAEPVVVPRRGAQQAAGEGRCLEVLDWMNRWISSKRVVLKRSSSLTVNSMSF